MSKRYENNRDWLADHLRILMDIGKRIHESDRNLPSRTLPSYEKGDWTALKLICLAYYVPVYLNILGKNRKVAYVDLFAGPGLNLIGDAKVPLPGSALIPVEHPGTHRHFDLHLYSDTNAEYTAALNKRLEPYTRKEGYAMFGDSIEVRNTDANEFVKSVPDMLRRHGISHSLVFVDPEGLELRWDSLASMANGCRYADWIILFPSAGLLRLKGRRDDASWERIREFIGPYAADLTHDSSEEDFIEAYRRNLASIGLDSSTEIAVTGTGSFHYHLIPAVRTTKGGSPWFRSMIDVKRRIESMTGETIGVVIQQIEGRMGVL